MQANLFESQNTAEFSPCRIYRYTLWRVWGDKANYAQFIGLNPSTADETNDDPTIRRCIEFARSWGYGALCMTNLFAYRATQPKEMMKFHSPVGEENDRYLIEIAENAKIIIAAWGKDGTYLNRAERVRKMLNREMFYLRISEKTGQPYHPLYLPKTSVPILYESVN